MAKAQESPRPRKAQAQDNKVPRRKPTVNRDTYRKPRVSVRSARGGMSFSASIVAALFFGFVIVYMVWSAYGFFQPSVQTEVVRMGSLDMQTSVSGMIIRYETAFYSDRAGQVMPSVEDFSRVRQNDIVFTIRDIDAVSRNIESLSAVEEQIIDLHNMNPDPAIARINSNILNVLDRNLHVFSQTNLNDVYALFDNLYQVTRNRNQIKIGQSSSARADLARDHELLMQYDELTSYNMYAARSGIMSPFIDEYVGEFRPDNMRSLSREQLSLTVDHTTIVPAREVEAGDSVFKIVDNTWYVVTFMPVEMITFEEGQQRVFYLENMNTGRFMPVPMRIEYISNDLRERRVILRSNRYAVEFLNQRNVNIRTTYNIQSGLKIPVSAIAEQRFLSIPLTHVHRQGTLDYHVIHLSDEGLRVVNLEPDNISATNVYIPINDVNLRMGDILTPVNPADTHIVLSEIHTSIIRGVFRTNLDFAEFRQIHYDYEILETDSHILLDPARNAGIRQFDTIVTDAITVRNGQVIS